MHDAVSLDPKGTVSYFERQAEKTKTSCRTVCLQTPEKKNTKNELTFHTLPHLKCIRLVSVRLSLPCIYIGVQIELKKTSKLGKKWYPD